MFRLAILVGLLFPFAGLSATSGSWSDYAEEIIPVEGVYRISTPGQLAWIALRCNASTGSDSFSGKTLLLETDLDLSAHEWVPIGNNTAHPFSGLFNGQRHTIAGLMISSPTTTGGSSFTGLFGCLSNGKIQNVILRSPLIRVNQPSLQSVGVLSAYMYEAAQKCTVAADTQITGCEVIDAEVSCTLSGNVLPNVGMVAAYSYYGYIADCKVSGSIVVSAAGSAPAVVGGVVGGGGAVAAIVRCQSAADITLLYASGGGLGAVGGILGQHVGPATLSECVSTGTLRSIQAGGGMAAAGGICGVLPTKAVITHCRALNTEVAAISTAGTHLGRISGQQGAFSNNGALSTMKLLHYRGNGVIPAVFDTDGRTVDLSGCSAVAQIAGKSETTMQGVNLYPLSVSVEGDGLVSLSVEGVAVTSGDCLCEGDQLALSAAPTPGSVLQSLTINGGACPDGSPFTVRESDLPTGRLDIVARFSLSDVPSPIVISSTLSWDDATNEGADVTITPTGRLNIAGTIGSLGTVTLRCDLRSDDIEACGELDGSAATWLGEVKSVVLEFYLSPSTDNRVVWNGVALPVTKSLPTVTDGNGNLLIAIAPDRLLPGNLADPTLFVSMTYDGADRATHGLNDVKGMNNWRYCLPTEGTDSATRRYGRLGELVATRAPVIRVIYTGEDALALVRGTGTGQRLIYHRGAAGEEHHGWNLVGGGGRLVRTSLGLFSQRYTGAGYMACDDEMEIAPFNPTFVKVSQEQAVTRSSVGIEKVGIELVDSTEQVVDRSYIVVGEGAEMTLPKMMMGYETCQWFPVAGLACCVVNSSPLPEIELPLYVRCNQPYGLSFRLSSSSSLYSLQVNGEELAEGKSLSAKQGVNSIRLVAVPTSITKPCRTQPRIFASSSQIVIERLDAGQGYRVLSVAGVVLAEGVSNGMSLMLPFSPGIYLVCADRLVRKVVVRD